MQLLTIFALFCLLAPPLSARAQPKHCQKPATSATKMCYNEANYTLRFTYNHTSGKCDQIWWSSCSRRSKNSFGTFKECMRVCNPTSKCLQTRVKHKGWIPLKTSYVFDINTLNCTKEKSFRTPDTGSEYNRFLKEEDCKNTCEPDLVQIIRSSG
uniref:Hypothetical Kunitz-type peptidase inhibitor n=1 Tax=Amblyomma americanum TaxID=6943 RepID=B5M725_AMBAM